MSKRIYLPALFTVALSNLGSLNLVQAADRVALNQELLKRIQSVKNGLDNVRVYPSRRLVIQRSTPLNAETSVDGSVDTEFEGKARKEILGYSTPGKILAIETIESFGGRSAPEDTLRIVVSFDSHCTTQSCAFTFENPVAERKLTSNHTYLVRSPTSFLLADFPDDAETPRVDALWVGHRPLFWERLEWSFNVFRNKGRDLTLQVKLEELFDIERDTVRHDGWDR